MSKHITFIFNLGDYPHHPHTILTIVPAVQGEELVC